MIEIIALVLVSVVFATLLQEKIWFPSVIFYIIVGLLFAHFYPTFLKFSPLNFHYLVLITLPFLIASDTFWITWESIKKNYISILLLAFVNVVFTVVAIVAFWNIILPELGVLMLILLASTISPTDPVGVNSALSGFKVPHKLWFKLESESLANDVVALSIFSIAIGILLWHIVIHPGVIWYEVLKILIESLVVWIVIWYIWIFFLSKSEEVYFETFVVLTAIFISFLVTDHYLHVSWIFSVIVVMIVMNEKIKEIWKLDKKIKYKSIVHPENHNFVWRVLYFIAMLSNAFLFIALWSLVDFFDIHSYVWKYADISIYIFLFITIVRWLFMYIYSYISRKTNKIDRIDNVRWWAVLTFGWMRWGLSVLMIFILASEIPNYRYMQELEAIVFNVVFLITFIYTPILIYIFKKWRKDFEKEYSYEEKHDL